MRATRRALVLQGLLFCLAGGLGHLGAAEYVPSRVLPPAAVSEYRAVWIATVANIDWPSTNALTTARQKAELIALLDRAAALKLNTVLFQVRPACDALYASKIEPWSEYLTGTMGKVPNPYYDPLQFAIEEAHRRGLELHAWFNPFRARHRVAKSPVAAGHISRTHPAWVKSYGSYMWLDPGEPGARDYSLSVVLDVLRRYDVDGIHFDDYFYPYKEKDASGRDLPFPDGPSWERYGAGGKLSREDWRRENVNTFVERVYREIKSIKPQARFGISPFGIWRPGYPTPVRGLDAYDQLYADSRKWLVNGWCDYFAPQLYWPINAREQSFPVLLNWWAGENRSGRHLVPGLDCTRNGGAAGAGEIVQEIKATRRQAGAHGNVFWNATSLLAGNSGPGRSLQREVYAEPALVPDASWLAGAAPGRPLLTAKGGKEARLSWKPAPGETPWLWLLQTRRGDRWTTRVLPGTRRSWTSGAPLPDVIALRAVSHGKKLSTAATLELRKPAP